MPSNPVDIKMEAIFNNPGDRYSAYLLLPDKIILNYGNYNNQRLFFNEQEASFVPLPSDSDPYTLVDMERIIPAEFATKSNQQLQSQYQMSFGGSILPSTAVTSSGITGGKIDTWQTTTLNIPVCIDHAPDPEIDAFLNCLNAAGNNKVAGPMPAYSHPLVVCTPTAVEDAIEKENNIVLYPNPTTGMFSIEADHGKYRIDVINQQGSSYNFV